MNILNLPKSIQRWALGQKHKESEAWEQMVLVEWMVEKGLRYTSIPNSTYVGGWPQKLKNKATGLVAGFPDLVVIIPNDLSNTGKAQMIIIEMKKKKGSYAKPHQKAWIQAINECDIPCFVCNGSAFAIDILRGYMK